MDCLLVRLDAPLMSFGSVMVDQINPIDAFPGVSLFAGLLGNAFGWDHRDVDALQQLQTRLRHASRWDLEPEHVVDYQTADLGHDFMRETGWTTRGRREDRGKGDATTGTHQRWRHYWANGCVTSAVTLLPGDGPDIGTMEAALRRPARPLFIGRKTCLPAAPLLLGRYAADSLRAAVAAAPLADASGRRRPGRVRACWPIDEGAGTSTIEFDDLRDWRNNVHRGRQRYATGFLEVSP